MLGPLVVAASCNRDPGPASGTGTPRSSAPTAQREVPELDVPRVPGGPELRLDGVLDEPLWRAAASTGPFVHAGSGAPASEQAVRGRARLAWDERWLFVAFEVETQHVRGGFPADARDPHLWERDTVELMLDPDGDGDNRDYYEIQVSPQNLVFDSQFDDYNLPRGGPAGPFGHQAWSAGVESGVRVDGTLDDPSDADRGYTVEARIPWKSFAKAHRAPPAPGDRWRANCYAMQDNGGVAWSPILGQGNFHRARRFGRVHFVAASTEEASRP